MFTPIGRQFFSLMCEHGIVIERALEVLLFWLSVHFIGRGCQWFFRKFKSPLSYAGQLWKHKRWEASSRLDVLLSFLHISLHDLLRVNGDGFRSWVSCFLLLGLPIVWSPLWGVVFCSDFGPFFFLLLFPCWLLFLYLFIPMDDCHFGYEEKVTK
jgi:hypothetical protein